MEICRLKHVTLSSPPVSITQTAQAILVSSENKSIRYMTGEGEEIGFGEMSKDVDRPFKATAVGFLAFHASLDYRSVWTLLEHSSLLVTQRKHC